VSVVGAGLEPLRGKTAAMACLTAMVGAVPAAILSARASTALAARTNGTVRPGVGIDPIRLGMPYAKVRHLLGKPMLINRHIKIGFGNEFIEYGWDLTAWTVGVQGRRGSLKVVEVGSTLRTHRTRTKVGVGSTVSAIVRAFPSARCTDFFPLGRWVRVPYSGGRETVFVVDYGIHATPERGRVIEVQVRRANLPPYGADPRFTHACRSGWRRT
jgi:hypothetical protein